VQHKLSARFARIEDWTVLRAGEIAEEIERNAAELSRGRLRDLVEATTMLQVNPAMPQRPVVIRRLIISVARWGISKETTPS
jgi:hypothetical protein